MYFYKCPNCLDIFYDEKLHKECKCFKCGAVFNPPKIKVENWIIDLESRLKK